MAKKLPKRNCVVCGRWFQPKTDVNSICRLNGDQCVKMRRNLICTLWYADPGNRRRHISNVVVRRKKKEK